MSDEHDDPPLPTTRVSKAALIQAQADLQAARDELETVRGERDTARREATGLRGENTKLKTDAETVRTARDAAEAALRAENDTRIAALQQQIDQGAVSYELRTAAIQAGVHNADAALKLADLSTIKRGEDGAVAGVPEALEALKTAHPYLFGDAPKPGVAIGTTASPGVPPRPALPAKIDARTLSKEDAAVLEKQISAGTYVVN